MWRTSGGELGLKRTCPGGGGDKEVSNAFSRACDSRSFNFVIFILKCVVFLLCSADMGFGIFKSMWRRSGKTCEHVSE